ncbi:MAG: hypothetical protein WBM48_00960 [Polyangiales bacterium]|jgi:cysteine-rich repeat protein
MKKNILNTILIGLLAILAMACGASGADPLEGDPGFTDELGEEEGVNDDDQNDDEQDDLVENDDDVDDEEELVLDEPFCGDGLVDDGEACDDGNGEDGDGCSSICEVEAFAGDTVGEIVIDLIVDDLNSNEAPLEVGCTGDVAVSVSEGVLAGDGRCALPNNFLDYTVDAAVDEDGAVEGDITIVLNNRPNVLAISGTLEDGALSLEFDGVTLLVGSIRGVWDGTIVADFD